MDATTLITNVTKWDVKRINNRMIAVLKEVHDLIGSKSKKKKKIWFSGRLIQFITSCMSSICNKWSIESLNITQLLPPSHRLAAEAVGTLKSWCPG